MVFVNKYVGSSCSIAYNMNCYITEEGSGKSKTWKDKFGMSKKKHSGGSPSVERIATVPEAGGMFGVPLDDCVPSPNNEVRYLRTKF